MDLRRGDVVVVALEGDYGKPRPALVVQSDLFTEKESVVLLPLTSTIIQAPAARIDVVPTSENGLRMRSQIMAEKPTTVPVAKVGGRLGRLDDEPMRQVDRALLLVLGLTG